MGQGLKQASFGQCVLKKNETEQCYTSFIIWVRCRNRPCYWFKSAIDRNWNMLSPMMKLSDVNSQS